VLKHQHDKISTDVWSVTNITTHAGCTLCLAVETIQHRGGDNWEGTYEIGCLRLVPWSNVDGS
jgi:hypothetical protein